jgi:predicted nucleotidyltransferase
MVQSGQETRQEMPSQAAALQNLDEIVRRVVQIAQPEQIILFGSAARGGMTADSDIDLLIIKRGAHRRHLAQALYRGLMGVGVGVDVIVVTPEDVERYRTTPALIIEPALREGKVIYAA